MRIKSNFSLCTPDCGYAKKRVTRQPNQEI